MSNIFVQALYNATPTNPTTLPNSATAISAGYILKVIYYNSGAVPATVSIKIGGVVCTAFSVPVGGTQVFEFGGPFYSDGSAITHESSVAATITQTTVIAS